MWSHNFLHNLMVSTTDCSPMAAKMSHSVRSILVRKLRFHSNPVAKFLVPGWGM
jgi:hypothetical protein